MKLIDIKEMYYINDEDKMYSIQLGDDESFISSFQSFIDNMPEKECCILDGKKCLLRPTPEIQKHDGGVVSYIATGYLFFNAMIEENGKTAEGYGGLDGFRFDAIMNALSEGDGISLEAFKMYKSVKTTHMGIMTASVDVGNNAALMKTLISQLKHVF